MKFFNQDLCKKLFELGCISQTGYYWEWKKSEKVNNIFNEITEIPEGYKLIKVISASGERFIPAFSIYDFLSDEEYAEKNCKKIIALEVCVDCGKSRDKTCLPPTRKAHAEFCPGWQYLKLTLAHSKNQEAYIEQAVNMVINGKV